MIKKLFSVLFALVLWVSLTVCVSAASQAPFLVDDADLLTDSEETVLRLKLEDLSHKYGAQIAVVTTVYVDNDDIGSYIKTVYDGQGYGYGSDHAGVLLLISMDLREFRILRNGFAGDAITLGDIDTITELITPDLADGEYADALDAFADECAYYIDGYLNGFPFNFGANLLISLGIGLVVALIVTGSMKGELKSVRKQDHAGAYVKAGSLQLTQANDFFLYRRVTKTAKPKNQTSSSSRSGSSRNVGGGRF